MDNLFSTQPFFILEYQTIDSLGRGKEWLSAGIARNQDEIEAKRSELQAGLKGKKFNLRSHPYSHGLGAMEKCLTTAKKGAIILV